MLIYLKEVVTDFIPETYHIPTGSLSKEYLGFRAKYIELKKDSSFKNLWIIKPGEITNRGNGIIISNSLSEIT